MKNLLLITSFILATYSSLFCGVPMNPPPTGDEPTYTSAVNVSQGEWDTLTTAYKSAHETGIWGGNLNKTQLEAWLGRFTQSSKLVYFRFITEPSSRKTTVEFSAGKNITNIPCIRNGANPLAYCPTACNLVSEACPGLIEMPFLTYAQLGNTYKGINPANTLGGNIDKSALLAIINSLPEETTTVAFRFCTDPVYNQTSIIFTGGGIGQPPQEILYLRNGRADSFCPTNCNND